MGLAAPKNRIRIANDPQNTTWANNTERFGHRMLISQGWQPGGSLGAKDAAHASHYTAASQSHIRVFLKEDNLGLGAKRGSERAENFGLAGLESVLGRLNGRAEEVKKEEERREKIEQRAYVYSRYGMMNFVSGGFLVGDKIERSIKKEVQVKVEIKSEPESSEDAASDKKTKKRKRNSEDDGEIKKEDEEPKLKRKRKSVNLRDEASKDTDMTDTPSDPKASKKEKKDKKDRKERKSKKSSDSSTPDASSSASSAKDLRKAEKRARKEEKKLKKALKKAAKEAARSNAATSDASSSSDEDEDGKSTPATSVTVTGTSTPSSSGLAFQPRGLHAVRQRFIRQKQMATMDTQALKEIFMIKSTS